MTKTTTRDDRMTPAEAVLWAEGHGPKELEQLRIRIKALEEQREAAVQLMDEHCAGKTVKAGFWGGVAANYLLENRALNTRLADAQNEQRQLSEEVSEANRQLHRYAEAHVAALKQVEATERLAQALHAACAEASSLLAVGERAKRLMAEHAAARKVYETRQHRRDQAIKAAQQDSKEARDARPHLAQHSPRLDETLPALGDGEYFTCSKGCGRCEPVAHTVTYVAFEETGPLSTPLRNYMSYRSACCLSPLVITSP